MYLLYSRQSYTLCLIRKRRQKRNNSHPMTMRADFIVRYIRKRVFRCRWDAWQVGVDATLKVRFRSLGRTDGWLDGWMDTRLPEDELLPSTPVLAPSLLPPPLRYILLHTRRGEQQFEFCIVLLPSQRPFTGSNVPFIAPLFIYNVISVSSSSAPRLWCYHPNNPKRPYTFLFRRMDVQSEGRTWSKGVGRRMKSG